MAMLQFRFSEQNRKCMGATLAIFCTMQAIIGLLLCTCGIYFRLHLQWKILLIEGYNSETLYKLILSVGILTFALNLIGAKICYDCGYIETRSRFDKVIFLWLLLVFILGITQFSTSMHSFHHTRHARNHFKIGFITSMKNYLRNPDTKSGMDYLQRDHECCGAENFKDWMITDWVPQKFNPIATDPSLRKEYLEYYENMPLKDNIKENQLIVTPFSCCDPKYSGPCFHDFIAQSRKSKASNPLAKSQWWEGQGLFQKGCVSLLMEAYNEYLTFTGYFFLASFLYQTLIIFITRYLQTSIDNIEMYGRDDGSAPGWMCDCS